MYATNYHRASTVEEAVSTRAGKDEGRYLAGGMTLIATMKQRLAAPGDLIDLRHIPTLHGIRVEGNTVVIGATTTHAEVAASPDLRDRCPALRKLAGHIGDPHVRHMGTIGGSLANNDPAADYPAAMLALGATIVTDRRSIVADEFFRGLFETALEDDEMITAVRFDLPRMAGYAKFDNPASRFALTGVFVAKGDSGVRVAVTGAGSDGVFRHAGLEAALAGEWSESAIAPVQVDSANLMSDLHATADYRANLIKVMAKRALASAN